MYDTEIRKYYPNSKIFNNKGWKLVKKYIHRKLRFKRNATDKDIDDSFMSILYLEGFKLGFLLGEGNSYSDVTSTVCDDVRALK